MTIVTVEENEAGQRLDRFMVAKLPDMSRSRLQGLIAQGALCCKGMPVTDANTKVKAGQEFTLTIPETVPSHIVAQDIALDIVYEDEHMLVINKQAGLTVHPGAGNPDMTLVNALLSHCGSTLSGIGGVARPGIIHRIDKDTTGLLVVAKHDAAHIALSAQLADRSLKRTYAAVVWGVPSPRTGTITGNIGRSMSNRQKMAVLPKGGKPAVTHYKVVASYESPVASLVECNLETGRTHQIRVHLTHIGHPLVGDPVYGKRQSKLAFNRQALHAKELVLIHPATGKKMTFTCELPEDMKGLIKALE